MDRGPDPAALDRWITWPMMARDQKDQPIAARDRLVEPAIDCSPGTIEIETMKIEDGIGFDHSAAKALVPGSVEGSFTNRDRLWSGRGRRHAALFPVTNERNRRY